MEPWFDPKTAGLIGGIIGAGIGMLGVLTGCSCGICISKGWKKPIYAMFIFGIVIGSGLLITGIAALCVKQPWYIWFIFMLPGFIVTLVFPCVLPVVRKEFIQREMKKMQAEDL